MFAALEPEWCAGSRGGEVVAEGLQFVAGVRERRRGVGWGGDGSGWLGGPAKVLGSCEDWRRRLSICDCWWRMCVSRRFWVGMDG